MIDLEELKDRIERATQNSSNVGLWMMVSDLRKIVAEIESLREAVDEQ